MVFTRYTFTVAATLLLQTVAQQSNIVPEDMRGGFIGKGTEVQVSYTNDPANGFADGTTFDKNAVAQEPRFALGDSSGITPSVLHTVVMIDTTCPGKRVLHYARSNFKNNFDKTIIDTKSAALLDYKAPGSFGETGDNRQYSFLLYINPQRKQIDSLQLPAEGESFDVTKFQTDNGLSEPVAGVGMVIKLGGQADCGGDQPNGLPDNLPSARPPTSTAANSRPSTTLPPAGQRSTTAANAAPTISTIPGNNGTGNSTNRAPVSSGVRTTVPVPAASGNGNDGFATSTVVLSSAGPNEAAGATGAPSPSPAQQTTNAASGMLVHDGGLFGLLFVVAGLVMW
ncbi:hypothetical protein DE146DRAFT_694818 [Phaeosphaeria sp. MPI-PUGE-AT-0046c]|nr:hypothetical protein DE146DRAFT_694818 [Phaeosphaeria sp. MPI-PUGE-AT-0046c]